MKKTLSLLLLAVFLFGCGTSWETRRQEANEAYQKGELSEKAYKETIDQINKEEKADLAQREQTIQAQHQQQETLLYQLSDGNY